MNTESIRKRFVFVLVTNVIRSGIAFFCTTLTARFLGPEDFGNYTFLTSSFTGVLFLLDLGSSNAFYTLICEKPRSRRYVMRYLGWQIIQVVLVASGLAFILPNAWVEKLWLGQPRVLIASALFCIFFQKQIWLTVSRMGESLRFNRKIQSLSLTAVILQLMGVLVLWKSQLLSPGSALLLITFVYFLVSFIGWSQLLPHFSTPSADDNFSKSFQEFKKYCYPLVIFNLVSFSYTFLDPWMLQKFSGAHEQSYFSIANQFSMISLIATSSMVSIFWKEVAEAHGKNDTLKISRIYQKASRLLMFTAGTFSGIFIPWTPWLVRTFIGSDFEGAAIPLMIMFLYPIHQTLGQLNGVVAYATHRTRLSSSIGIGSMILSTLLAYFLLAPTSYRIPGLEMGAIGLSLRIFGVNLIITLLLRWLLTRRYAEIRMDWFHQFLCIFGPLFLGTVLQKMALFLSPHGTPTFLVVTLSGICYAILMAGIIFRFPYLLGAEREDRIQLLQKLKKMFNQ